MAEKGVPAERKWTRHKFGTSLGWSAASTLPGTASGTSRISDDWYRNYPPCNHRLGPGKILTSLSDLCSHTQGELFLSVPRPALSLTLVSLSYLERARRCKLASTDRLNRSGSLANEDLTVMKTQIKSFRLPWEFEWDFGFVTSWLSRRRCSKFAGSCTDLEGENSPLRSVARIRSHLQKPNRKNSNGVDIKIDDACYAGCVKVIAHQPLVTVKPDLEIFNILT